ncbi:hypothetical protein ACJX0J_038720, partial [Zea mays]
MLKYFLDVFLCYYLNEEVFIGDNITAQCPFFKSTWDLALHGSDIFLVNVNITFPYNHPLTAIQVNPNLMGFLIGSEWQIPNIFRTSVDKLVDDISMAVDIFASFFTLCLFGFEQHIW